MDSQFFAELFKHFAEAISPALQVLLQSLFVALAAQASAWMVKEYKKQQAKLSADQARLLQIVVSSAVRAAEQMYTDGEQKREFALEVVEKALQNYGVTIDLDVIAAEVEAQVYSNFNEGK